jgi:signal transduction protein with GAF and PtsI domain
VHPAQNVQFWLMLQVACLVWQVSSLAVSRDFVICGLGGLFHHGGLVLPSGADSRR